MNALTQAVQTPHTQQERERPRYRSGTSSEQVKDTTTRMPPVYPNPAGGGCPWAKIQRGQEDDPHMCINARGLLGSRAQAGTISTYLLFSFLSIKFYISQQLWKSTYSTTLLPCRGYCSRNNAVTAAAARKTPHVTAALMAPREIYLLTL